MEILLAIFTVAALLIFSFRGLSSLPGSKCDHKYEQKAKSCLNAGCYIYYYRCDKCGHQYNSHGVGSKVNKDGKIVPLHHPYNESVDYQ